MRPWSTGGIILAEARVGLHPGTCGGDAALVSGQPAHHIHSGQLIGLAIGAAMILNLFMAGLSGVLVPLGLKYFGVDPALASAAFVTAVTDTMGYLFFLGLATFFLRII